MSFNLATILRESALADPDKPMLKFGDTSLSYRQVDAMSGRLTAGLRAAGLGPGDTLALQLPNVPQFVFPTSARSRPGGLRQPEAGGLGHARGRHGLRQGAAGRLPPLSYARARHRGEA